MSTRKLILLALACGLAILLAGGIKLFQIARDPQEVELLEVGTSATIGDMTVNVVDIRELADATEVDVTLQGVDGDEAEDGWRILGDRKVLEPDTTTPPCPTTQVGEAVACTLRFDPVEALQAVAYVRAGEQRQWAPG